MRFYDKIAMNVVDPHRRMLETELRVVIRNLGFYEFTQLLTFIKRDGHRDEYGFDKYIKAIFGFGGKAPERKKEKYVLLKLRKRITNWHDSSDLSQNYKYYFILENLGMRKRRLRVYYYSTSEINRKLKKTISYKKMIERIDQPIMPSMDNFFIDALLKTHSTPIKVITYNFR